MKQTYWLAGSLVAAISAGSGTHAVAAAQVPPPPGFSLGYMDKTVEPGKDFYRYADGTWVKQNPVPADKSRWGAFMELRERNWHLVREILESTAAGNEAAKTPAGKVAAFYRSAMDTNRLERLGLTPLADDLKRIDSLNSPEDLLRLLADFHRQGVHACFGASVSPDAKDSTVYAFYFSQGGLGMPDRDYYLSDRFAGVREAYTAHVAKMFGLLGDGTDQAKAHAATVMSIETALAQASKTRVELRDPIANYHKYKVADFVKSFAEIDFTVYLEALGLGQLREIIVRQPEFFQALYDLRDPHPIEDWQVYLKWHLVRASAPYLNSAAEDAAFAFYDKVVSGQEQQEPRWQRSAHVIDGAIGETLGEIFVARHFPPTARARMNELVLDIKAVFRDRLQKLDWMTDATRQKALAKFDRFSQKIGHPDKFRDYSAVEIRPDDYLGNVERAERFEFDRELRRVGKTVDRTEWHMTPQTVNAYFNAALNEIVFPAGILQPPFFDAAMDNAVNYGAIGVVIGHEITHGYDDQGRKFDADGNLNDWWTEADAKAFEARAQKVVAQYDAYEVLPGLHVNGKLTLGENIADLGGTSIAYEALQRALARDPAKRKKIDGFTPEQRFFLSMSQVWRTNCREAEARRLVTVDPHSPGQFRAIGAHVNLQEFYDSFGIGPGAAMWRAPELRARIW